MRAVLLGLFGWAGLDLMLRCDLPGSGRLQHAGFRAVVVPLEWLTEGESVRLELLLACVGPLLLAAVIRRRDRWAKGVLAVAAAVAAVAALMTISLAALMERQMALGLSLAGLVYLSDPSRRRRTESPVGLPTVILVVGSLLTSVYYIYALFMTRGEGYPLLRLLGDALRGGQESWFPVWVSVVSLLACAAIVAERPPWKPFVLAAALGSGVAAWGEGVAGVLVVVVSLGLINLLLPRLLSVEGHFRLPALLALPCLLASLLFGHTYSARVLTCPPADHPRLRKLAESGEVFRLALNQHDSLGLALRADQRFGRLSVGAAAPVLEFAAPGPLALEGHRDSAQLFGSPEELVYAPSLDSFFGSFIPAVPGDWAPEERPVAKGAWNSSSVRTPVSWRARTEEHSQIRNLIVRLDGQFRVVEDAFGIPGLCWINTLHWSEDEGVLYIGCEERSGLYRYDPNSGQLDHQGEDRLGDVQDLAIGSGNQADRLYTISLWRSSSLTELKQSSLEILRQVEIGGMHYHLAYDEGRGRLYASSYYGGRIHVVDAASMEKVDVLQADFGTREVVVHPAASLLMASSTYSGSIRLWSLDGDRPIPLETLQVGGHIKDIRVDPEGPRAWTWSQCGIYEIDLAGL